MNAADVSDNKERSASPAEWSRKGEDKARVLRTLEELCDRQKPGSRIPTHTELMRQFNASQRSVLLALAELKRRGRIVRRHGSGTYVGTPDGMYPIASMGPDAASKTIVVIAKPDHGFFDDCISQLYSHADSRDYEIVYQLLRSQEEALPRLQPILGSAAGFILFGYNLAPLGKALLAAGNHVVIVGSPNVDEQLEVPCVCGDHEAGGYLAVKHLIETGHRRIGFPVYLENELLNPRWLGYRRALDEALRAGLRVTNTTIDAARLAEWEADPKIAIDDLSKPGSPTALVVWNDFTAVGLLETLRRAQVRVPEDVSIIGYDNSSVAATLTPPLTTIDSGVSQLLSAAIRTVLLPSPAEPAMVQMTIPNLVVRESVAKPRS
ncbi:MAG: substrate-binding domain-containing protein [Capsulimonadaceae bacterium]|nr:substrate-binding domain-containing protein [Capsulimonadaceae bacterium]